MKPFPNAKLSETITQDIITLYSRLLAEKNKWYEIAYSGTSETPVNQTKAQN
jgi:hypothetical protein